jgi:hypothetical protein
MKEARQRHALAKNIEHFIRLSDRGRLPEAAQLCAGHEVPFEVTHRVLLKPKQRRKS